MKHVHNQASRGRTSAAARRTRSTFVPILIAYIRSRAIDPAPLLERFSLPADVDAMPTVELSLDSARALYDAAARLVGDPNLGLHIARARRRGEYGVLEFAARSAPTVLSAFQRVVRYQRLLNDAVDFSLERRDGGVALEHAIAGEPACFGRHCNEYGLAMLVILARELSRTRVAPLRVWLAHPAPADCSALAAFFATDQLEFSAGANGLLFDAATLARRVVTADDALLSVMDSYAALLVAPGRPADPLQTRVCAHIRGALAQGAPQIDEVAAALSLRPRTLQRRLGEQGTSFHRLLDDVRRQAALEHLADPRTTLRDVAFLLGYAEARPFMRAFKRWTGKTPQQYRDGLSSP